MSSKKQMLYFFFYITSAVLIIFVVLSLLSAFFEKSNYFSKTNEQKVQLNKASFLNFEVDERMLLIAKSIRKIRGFVIVRHIDFGFLLLKAYKKSKGEYYQTPGGHCEEIDREKYMQLCNLKQTNSKKEDTSLDDTETTTEAQAFLNQCAENRLQKEAVGKICAARELYEETGIDIRDNLDRMTPLSNIDIKNTYFFTLIIDNEDSYTANLTDSTVSYPESKQNFTLKLSPEHIGFTFVESANTAAELVRYHSGGRAGQAFQSLQE